MSCENLTPPAGGKVSIENGKLVVPDQPVIPFIEGDGTGPDIWAAAQRVLNAAVAKAYGGSRELVWFEVFAGQKAFDQFDSWLPEDTLKAFREYSVGIKGPLTTPVGGGIRSLNVALRQELDLYVCQRPVRHFEGVQSPVKQPELVDMVIFRENTEDIYAGIEFEEGSDDIAKLKGFLQETFPDRRYGGNRPEARLRGGHRATRKVCHRLRPRQGTQERHSRAQGEHHEVHRGCLP